MANDIVTIERPQRWDHPLDPKMNLATATWLLKMPPFSSMDSGRFANSTPLAEVVRNDCRLIELKAGDVLFQAGQYGDSAYLVLGGKIRIFLEGLRTQRELERRRSHRRRNQARSWLGWLKSKKGPDESNEDRRARTRTRSQPRDMDSSTGLERSVLLDVRHDSGQSRVFLQDIPGVLSTHQTSCVQTGELFGEMAAVTRTPREFTAAAETDAVVLQIRWQGLKLLKQDPAFRESLDERYRSSVLRSHLKEIPLFRFCPEQHLSEVISATKFEQFGDLEWYAKYRKQVGQSPAGRIAAEPLIAEEGQYAAALWIVRSGFARLSRRQGAGHRTLAYLGKGQLFGLRDLTHNLKNSGHSPPLPYQESLRAIGYVDVLQIPKSVVQQHVLPFIRAEDLPPSIQSPRYEFGQPVLDAPLTIEDSQEFVETGLLEFLVDQRLMNGRKTMMIDMTRCTRCDDCVRACAATHSGTPVFVRNGPQYGPWMFAHACMHCEDPVCMIGCPTGAIHRDAESGLVIINESTCIGCKSCAESCPYDNIRMVATKDSKGRARVDQANGQPILRASKCDFCSDSSATPICQTACPHGALVRIDLSNIETLNHHLHVTSAQSRLGTE